MVNPGWDTGNTLDHCYREAEAVLENWEEEGGGCHFCEGVTTQTGEEWIAPHSYLAIAGRNEAKGSSRKKSER